MGHDHSHTHGRAGSRHAGRLKVALGLIVAFLVVQVVVGVATGSLAVLSDAGHMATDALGLAMALAAITAANRTVHPAHRTFGLYRLEILAALANAVLLLAVAGYVLVEAARRWDDPPEVSTLAVFLIGVVGLAVNIAAFLMLRAGAEESLNVRGAYLEVVSDALGSLGVIIGAVAMWSFGWAWIDPLVGAAIGLFIVPRAWRLGRDALRVLVQAAPANLDPAEIRAALLGLSGVADVHDLHVWTLTSEMEVFTAHLAVAEASDLQAVLHHSRQMLADRFGLSHATLQVEVEGDPRCDEIGW